mgnify:CR=1 FL=1
MYLVTGADGFIAFLTRFDHVGKIRFCSFFADLFINLCRLFRSIRSRVGGVFAAAGRQHQRATQAKSHHEIFHSIRPSSFRPANTEPSFTPHPRA